ncbi:zf-CCHC domain-containing protein/MP domain-containing protein [Cucumis melo var. makuwa]|uniref:Zf-CCHC domain-containing protein/MP domain-containing protein n=1 Tax=Cucumis melo var. makuwa TaxID=1194695 RepID=A0A5D3CK15_CUCMM|nr:zf-CCHC domain-containing protein/MP domain-containing protein [Cucumis melo var. makuwa]TYK12151.1 zf-CCHC domain-containing protein/MP domain-containing protein [Cucumis melo var. makuwa]
MVTNSRGTYIDWEGISYGDINSTIQKVCLEICQQQKHGTKIVKDSNYRKKLESFCRQYGIDNTHPSRKKIRSKKVFGRSKMSESHGYSNRKKRYHGKNKNKRKFFKESTTCFKCNKKGHYVNRCPVVKKINLMEIDENEKQSLLKVVKAEELSFDEEEFSSEKEEDLLNALLEESLKESSSSENETDNEDVIPCFGCINVLTST